MSYLETGSHGSTFGGSPLGNRVALEAVKILEEENLAENARKLGQILRNELEKLPSDIATEFRGRGLLTGLVINKGMVFSFIAGPLLPRDLPIERRLALSHLFLDFANGWDICLRLKEAGLLSRPAHGQILRISPPLTITKQQLEEGLDILIGVLRSYK